VEELHLVGASSAWTAQGAREAGLTNVVEHPSRDAAAAALRARLHAGDWLLIKGSRSAALDLVATALTPGEEP
jgi:UDP-N-acetylmuramyl pentapeptide synthase